MLNLSHEQIDAIRNSVLRHKLVESLPGRLIVNPLSKLSKEEIAALHDACLDLLTNESPIVREFVAEQDCGPYSVVIRGVPGAYYVQAQDFDDMGVFSDLKLARSQALDQHGEFISQDRR
jgi:hypothetical protein